MRLDLFSNPDFDRGASRLKEALWFGLSIFPFSSRLPGSAWRVALLRLFGANIGKGVIFKPGVQVKFPWQLTIGDNCWIGERVWIDNLAKVRIGSHCCISQGAYLCTGSHDWSELTFDLQTKPITLEDSAWVAAKSVVAPGVVVKQGAVLALGSVAYSNLNPWTIYQGNPACLIKKRIISP